MDQLNDDNEKYSRASLDDYELGRLLGCGCNAAVYEARLRSSAPSSETNSLLNSAVPIERQSSESDIEILSRQSSFEYINETDDDDKQERINETTLNEGTVILIRKRLNFLFFLKKTIDRK